MRRTRQQRRRGLRHKHANVEVTALGDLFDDRIEKTKARFGEMQKTLGRSEVKETFRGPHAYLHLVRAKVDMVIIASPPYFHPLHLEAALNADKHTYLEKPVATDVRGCKRVAALAKKAQGKVSVDVGFQIRKGPLFAELTQRLYDGRGQREVPQPARAGGREQPERHPLVVKRPTKACSYRGTIC